MRVALMCAEKDPIDCHRCILVTPHLQQQGLQVLHILSDGSLEDHVQTEKRLLQIFALENKELFRSQDEIVTDAYKKQGEKVAYHEDELVLREEPPRYGN